MSSGGRRFPTPRRRQLRRASHEAVLRGPFAPVHRNWEARRLDALFLGSADEDARRCRARRWEILVRVPGVLLAMVGTALLGVVARHLGDPWVTGLSVTAALVVAGVLVGSEAASFGAAALGATAVLWWVAGVPAALTVVDAVALGAASGGALVALVVLSGRRLRRRSSLARLRRSAERRTTGARAEPPRDR